MRRSVTILGWAIEAMILAAVTAQGAAEGEAPAEKSAPAAQAPTSPAWQQAEERAIRAVAEAFAKGYNAHDAKAVAALFTADAEAVDEEGNATQGRAAIEQVFAGIFAENPKTRIEVSVGSIRFPSPTVAIEDGSSSVIRAPNEPAERNRYMVVHVKQGGTWRMASARDLPGEPPLAEEQLKQLGWLVGDWVDESPESLIITSYRWTENHHYLVSDFTVQIGGRPAMTGSQRIGWDPLAKKLRSWVFDSEGGFVEGTWTRDGQRWLVKTTGVTRDGKPASATNVTTRVAKDRMTWESRDRSVGGDVMPNIGPVTIVRKPPQAK